MESNPQRVGPGPANQDGYDDREQGEVRDALPEEEKGEDQKTEVDQRYRPQEDPQEVVYPQDDLESPEDEDEQVDVGEDRQGVLRDRGPRELGGQKLLRQAKPGYGDA